MDPEADRTDAAETWWRRRLAGLEPRLDLPAARPHFPGLTASRPARIEVTAGGPTGCLAALDLVAARPSREVDTAVLLSGVAALCGHLTGRDDLALGTAVLGPGGRSGLAILRFRLAPDTTFGELLTQARALVQEATARGPVPAVLVPPEPWICHPFAQVVVAVRWPGEAAPDASSLRLHAAAPPFDLAWTLDRAVEPAALVLEHDADRFDAVADTFLRAVRELLARGLSDPAARLGARGVGPVAVT